MMKKTVPDTSKEAFLQVAPQMREVHHQKILSALKEIGRGSMEQIAAKTGMTTVQIARRMSEVEEEGFIIKDGKGKTTSGRSCYLYRLAPERSAAEVASLQEFLTGLQDGAFENPARIPLTQQELFQ